VVRTAAGLNNVTSSSDPPTPWVTWAAAQWTAALNQNLLHPDTAPVARELERRVVAWLAPAFGQDGGHLVPGSTVANLTALWVARDLHGVREVVASKAAHVSVRKAARLLGLPLREVDVDARQRMDPGALGDLSRSALVLTAGTTTTGAVDPLDCGKGAAWRHVDAAWAGPLVFSDRHRPLLAGVERADSVAVSAHKWLHQPKESALVLFADSRRAHATISFTSGYLAEPNVGVLGSHGAAAVPLLATLLAWGRDGIAAHIDHAMDLADRLADEIRRRDELELRHAPQTGVVLWRAPGRDPRAVRDRLSGAFVSVADLDGQTWWRSVAANPNADPERVVSAAVAALEHTAT